MVSIQPCALLLLIGPDWRVETVSANVAMLGDYKPGSVVGQPLADLIGSKAIHSLRNRISWLSSDESEAQDFGVQWGDMTLDLRAIHHEDRYLIEAELAVESRLPDGIGVVRSMTDRLVSNDPHALADQAMRQLNALTGFDHLMLVDRRGSVIAAAERSNEAALEADGIDMSRVIADRDSEPVPLIGNEVNGLVARAAYLAPSDDECQRLASLGIAATMALPLRIDGEQVATLHALHPVPRRCGLERRGVVHLFTERLVARMTRLGWQP